MSITKETKIYVVQILMRDEWTDINIKEQSLEDAQQRLELNKDNPFLLKYKHRLVKRITTMFEEVLLEG